MRRKIVVATGNKHKVQELSDLFRTCGMTDLELIPMSQIVGSMDIDETGLTFEENALIKAQAVFDACSLPTIADDSGLCIDVLSGQPGVRSARFGGLQATDAENRDAVRAAMRQHDVIESPARFVCVLCYIDQYRTLLTAGESSGTIVLNDQGSGGFGYDPMFIPEGFNVSYAQMSSEQKNSLSHRARATTSMVEHLARIEDETDRRNHDRLSRADLLTASIAAVIGRQDVVRSVAVRAIDETDHRRLYETLLQTYLFAGFPVALDALSSVHDVSASWSISHELEPYDVPLFERRGEELCRRVYGQVYERMMQRFDVVSPSMRSWMIIEGYGKTLSRPWLSAIERELCIVCMLAALGRGTQLYSHVRGAIALGAHEAELQECMDTVLELCGPKAYELLSGTYHTLVLRD
ncbi:MAG: hypothetical protein RIR53_517 [Bacteroidota bacterium]|jgi:XTP/dITP diphosphohydrolase